MRLLTLDFETFFDRRSYTLKRMTPAEYILDPRFETICVAASVDMGPVQVFDASEIPDLLKQFPAEDTITLTYNSLFDNAILAWRYNYVPWRMIDGLGVARYCFGHLLRSLSLEKVAEHLKIGYKGKEIENMSGVSRAMLLADTGRKAAFYEYAANDTYLLNEAFKKMRPLFPVPEYRVLDLVLRAAVCPVFRPNLKLLNEYNAQVIADKAKLVAAAKTDIDTLHSTVSFTQLLEDLGVDVETKVSKTGNILPAVAKTDDFMKSLQEHEDPRVQAVVAARLGVKSTLEETRSARLISIASLPWSGIYGHPVMPIPLRYNGAHTLRLSGDWKINMQNLPSGRGGRSTALRDSLEAPDGFEVVVGDLGQIEARLTAWLSHGPLLLVFREGLDAYKYMARRIFGGSLDDITDDQRAVGKAAVLGLGFGLGKDNFYTKTIAAARMNNQDISSFFTPKLAQHTVATYRLTEKPTVDLWALLDEILRNHWMGLGGTRMVGPVIIGPGFVQGPDGHRMHYKVPYGPPNGEAYPGYREDIWYEYGGRRKKIYGAAMLENIIQFLARTILFDAAVRMADHGYNFANTAHDELGYVVRKEEVDKVKKLLHLELTTPPWWAPDLPLKASVNQAPALSYGAAK